MSSVGFGLSPASGRAIRDLVVDGRCSFANIDKLKLDRFANLPRDWRERQGWLPPQRRSLRDAHHGSRKNNRTPSPPAAPWSSARIAAFQTAWASARRGFAVTLFEQGRSRTRARSPRRATHHPPTPTASSKADDSI
jgi:hypothetical protein